MSQTIGTNMVISLDYSLSCPCMCLAFDTGWSEAEFYYLTDVKKYEGPSFNSQVNGTLHQEYKTEEERYNQISDHFIHQLNRLSISPNTEVYIEDYSFGSKGKVFHIAENTGLAKWKLWKRGHGIVKVAPTVIKKFATGKGNAKKEQMYEAFEKSTGIKFTVGKTVGSPWSDIVDSYWLAQYAFTLTEDQAIIKAQKTIH